MVARMNSRALRPCPPWLGARPRQPAKAFGARFVTPDSSHAAAQILLTSTEPTFVPSRRTSLRPPADIEMAELRRDPFGTIGSRGRPFVVPLAVFIVLITASMLPQSASFGSDVTHAESLYELTDKGTQAYNRGDYGAALGLFERALVIAERTLPEENSDRLAVANNIALLYKERGRYADAAPLYLKVLTIEERSLGPDNRKTVITRNNLGALYRVQGRYAETEPLYLENLGITERTLGREAQQTLISEIIWRCCTTLRAATRRPRDCMSTIFLSVSACWAQTIRSLSWHAATWRRCMKRRAGTQMLSRSWSRTSRSASTFLDMSIARCWRVGIS
jgi:tetratricopeptide (TPR) repeat protein